MSCLRSSLSLNSPDRGEASYLRPGLWPVDCKSATIRSAPYLADSLIAIHDLQTVDHSQGPWVIEFLRTSGMDQADDSWFHPVLLLRSLVSTAYRCRIQEQLPRTLTNVGSSKDHFQALTDRLGFPLSRMKPSTITGP
jgi:hypothetical protein